MKRLFFKLNVFANSPLAVVVDSEGLDYVTMRNIAREFDLPETLFVCPPKSPINTASLRIFTPAGARAFSGYSLAAAALLAHLQAPALLTCQDLRVVLEEPIGEIVCVARHRRGESLAAYLTLPSLHIPRVETGDIANKLGLSVGEVGFRHHLPSVCGILEPCLYVPITTHAALLRATPRLGSEDTFYLYHEEERTLYHTRMFAGSTEVVADPQTTAGLAGVIAALDPIPNGEIMLTLHPGAMSLGLAFENNLLSSATLGGLVEIVSEDYLRV